MKDFAGLVAVVTGGSSGIGAAVAAQLTDRGATVVVLDLVAPEAGHEFVPCDLTSETDLARAVDHLTTRHGRLDVLVNNAGIGAAGDVTANDRDEWHRVLDVNVVSMARTAAAMMPLLRRSPSASLVNVSSVVAVVGVRNRVLYSATKGAIYAMTLAMAADHVTEGVRVNAVAPGTADTPWINRLLAAAADPTAEAAALRARQPMGRLVTADEVAHAVAYLASPLSASTTGTVLGVDGGMGTLKV
ncbi:SDR family oxidoreductase [Nocardioides marinquilinus]|uniref:SDR family oxidoreductase n=1 Tax=Nocardioides marinquilinus TaxID=1210400 RepID=A0ABP9PCC3_9ACTN